MIAAVFGEPVPKSIPEKKEMLERNHIALWDVIHSCEISGSSDSSISDVVPNDLLWILDNADIQKIIVNGKTAEKYYKKHIEPVTKRPANAAWSLEALIDVWGGMCQRGRFYLTHDILKYMK